MLWNMYHHHSDETENRLIGMIRPTWQITNWLSLRAQVSTDITDVKQTLKYESEQPNSLYDPNGSFQSINRRYGNVEAVDIIVEVQHNISIDNVVTAVDGPDATKI